MCGLVGFATNGSNAAHFDFLENALIADTIRGDDSTGVALLNNNKSYITKAAQDGYAFVNSVPYHELVSVARSKFNQTMAAIGHNRAATVGNINSKTAHPFRKGDITGAHNGTLWWHEHLASGRGKKFQVDSEAIMYALSQSKESVKVLEELDGAYALTWHDKRTNTLNFARNHERTLYIATSHKSILWASEEYMLKWLARRQFQTEVFSIKPLEVGQLVSYSLESNADVTKPLHTSKFNAGRAYPSSYYNGGYTNGNVHRLAYDDDYPVGNYTHQRPTGGNTAKKRQNITKSLVPSVTLKHGSPTWQCGLTAGESYTAVLEEFKYFSATGAYGRAYGYLEDYPEIKVGYACYDVDYLESSTVRVVVPDNYHLDDKGEPIVLVSKSYDQYSYNSEKVAVGDVSMTRAEFNRVAAQGCGWCSTPITDSMAPDCSVSKSDVGGSVILCDSCTAEVPWENASND